MFIRVDLGVEPPAVTLEEPEDCGRFHLEVVQRGDLSRLGDVLVRDGVGWVEDDDHAYISVVALRSLADGRVGADWAEEFERMLEYARGKGWMTPDGAEVQAHIERVAW